MRAVDATIGVIWVAFWVYWLAASVGVKRGRPRWGQLAGTRVIGILIVLGLVRARVFKGHMAHHDAWLIALGFVLFLSGLGLAVWARRYLGRNWGTPMSQKVDPDLVTSGPYRLIRHPIYSGIILATLGTALAVSWYWLVAVGLVTAYFVYSAVMEERYMIGQFPDAYPAYRKSTKMLVPYVF
jgi:protein-S-isoprenylcysteine O-methyltransferase Ste14